MFIPTCKCINNMKVGSTANSPSPSPSQIFHFSSFTCHRCRRNLVIDVWPYVGPTWIFCMHVFFKFHTNCTACMHMCGCICTLLYKLCCVWTVAHSTTSHLVDPYFRLMAASMMLVSAQPAITLPRSCILPEFTIIYFLAHTLSWGAKSNCYLSTVYNMI